MEPVLHVVMYHYVRDLPRTRFPLIKGMLLKQFREQVTELSGAFEMATLESAMAFLEGRYHSSRDLCLLTFDDGLKEHYTDVLPILFERRLEGVFSVITSCLEEHQVADVHMNHFLMAALKFEEYRSAFLIEVLKEGGSAEQLAVNQQTARRTYPWDSDEVASFKYFYNFVLSPRVREPVVRRLFTRYIGPEEEFAAELYASWEQVRLIQRAGMVIGGHSHRHKPLATLARDELLADLQACRRLLDQRLSTQPYWPFCYPYGKRDSFTSEAVGELRRLGFCCGLSTEPGPAEARSKPFEIRRIDCKLALTRSAAA